MDQGWSMITHLLNVPVRLAAGVLLLAAAAAAGAHIATPVPAAHAVANCVADETVDAEEQAFLALVNAHRAQNGRAPLGLSYTLSRAAAWKSRDLGTNAYFAHDDLDRTWDQRIRDCGYRYGTYLGENIAAGVASAQSAFDLWKNSSGHNANMLGTNYATIGIGREYIAGSPYGWYWTTEFGGVDDGYAAISQPAPLPVPSAAPLDATPPSLKLSVRRHVRGLTLTARTSDDSGIARVDFFVDGRPVASDASAPYLTSIPLPRRGARIEARALDGSGNIASRSKRWTGR